MSLITTAQTFTTNPAFPTADQPLTLTVDVSSVPSLADESAIWLWAWLPDCSSSCDAPTNVNPATSAQSAARFSSTADPDVFTLTFTPTTFFNKPADQIARIGFKVKADDWGNGQSPENLFIDISTGELEVSFSEPSDEYFFVDAGSVINIVALSSVSADLELKINNVVVETLTGTVLNYGHNVVESGTIEATVTASIGGEIATDKFYFIVRQATESATMPAGIIKGINYDADLSKVTLCLEAPGKSSVYVIGEFNNWIPSTTYQMKQDGELFWLEINGLNSGQEYAFQYFIDEEIIVGDPYADKILDPNNDPFVPTVTYPGLKTYPNGASGNVSVLQTSQVPYNWQITNFQQPAKEDLVIYELLVRDFDQEQNYQSIINRLDYLQGLGVNAIELMPIMEFSGNLSWGYNPSYFFAPDKYYGTKNDLKSFIDECHSRGIAVILDMVLNHTHEDNPLAQLYWNQSTYKPAVDNPWLNVTPRHPFNVFYDFNHESLYTQNFVDTVNHYWLHEYKFDGYRFDLTKGFTQDFTEGSDVGAWSAYNQKRIDLLKRMADAIWSHSPEAYVIFEHLADNSEEKVLADHGIMLWGNMNHNFNQNTLGFSDGSAIDWSYYKTRNWQEPNLIAYMESHDEERLVYRNISYGNSIPGSYNTKELDIALERVKATSAVYYAIGGPKMIWQFGELGYDKSIELNGRTGEKPIPWADGGLGYNEDHERLKLYDVTAELVKLKTSYPIFSNSITTINESEPLVKQVTLKTDPFVSNPGSVDEMNLLVVANFNLTAKDIAVSFPHTGNWYSYFANGDELGVEASPKVLQLQPGEFRIYTDIKLPAVAAELTDFVQPIAPTGLSAKVTGNEIELNWKDNSSIETNYQVWRSTGEGFELITTVNSNVSSYIDQSVEELTTYTYKVTAKNAHYTSDSEETTVTTTEFVTGINGGVSEALKVYPVPAKDYLKIDGIRGNSTYEILNLAGKSILAGNVNGYVDVSTLPKGVYVLTIKNSKDLHKIKFIKAGQ
ncbi:T9SS type A sorting domain-containing protein [Fulvivirga sp. 29W222]|uniref:T9SS type A sorting domain-containing protein n=1 Tax=Fulvivirga marina TaxID=2494733 RepID=A0A937G248_9BACT|nr:alpha-amylase family glycosyl hydrolase [Fulvivirga marina]MBL6449098.1 T9SS type A sorting domain-containing protein [Fulvivirga marina]